MSNRDADTIAIYIISVVTFFGTPALLAWLVVEGSKTLVP